MRYLATYTDSHGEIHKKGFATQEEAEAIYFKLHRVEQRFGISNIHIYDCGYCCEYFGDIWD